MTTWTVTAWTDLAFLALGCNLLAKGLDATQATTGPIEISSNCRTTARFTVSI